MKKKFFWSYFFGLVCVLAILLFQGLTGYEKGFGFIHAPLTFREIVSIIMYKPVETLILIAICIYMAGSIILSAINQRK